MRLSRSRSCSRESDRLASKRLIRVLITPEENATNILPELFPWELPLPWAPFTVRKTTAVCRERGDLARGSASQRMRTQVPAAALEPTLLPGPGMPAARPPLAGGTPPGQTSPGRPRQNAACPGRKVRRRRAKVTPEAVENPEVGPRVVTQQKIFFSPLMRSARLLRATREFAPQPGSLLLCHLPRGRSHRPRPGT